MYMYVHYFPKPVTDNYCKAIQVYVNHNELVSNSKIYTRYVLVSNRFTSNGVA